MTDSRQKVFCTIVRTDEARPALLVFESLDEPGFEVPKGSVEVDESLEGAVYRYRWLGVTSDLDHALVRGCNAFVKELIEVVRRGGSDAT